MRRAFSLIELLIAIAILVAITFLAAQTFSGTKAQADLDLTKDLRRRPLLFQSSCTDLANEAGITCYQSNRFPMCSAISAEEAHASLIDLNP